jgi:hypothetical protein
MMPREIKGKIIASTLAEFAETGVLYGYIGVEVDSGAHIRIKVDSYTWYETLEMGHQVAIEAETLGDTDILVARKITRLMPTTATSKTRETVEVGS